MSEPIRSNSASKIAEAFSSAVTDGPEDAICGLESIKDHYSGWPKLCINMAIAEIRHLNFEDQKAHRIFEHEIVSNLSNLTHDQQVIVNLNWSDIKNSLWLNDDFYEKLDLRRLVGIDLWNYDRYFEAAISEEKGRLYETYPAIWKNYLDAFETQCWRPFKFAAAQLAPLLAKTNQPQLAMYLACLSCDKETCEKVAQYIGVHFDRDVIANSIEFAMAKSALRRHSLAVCYLIQKTIDFLPDVTIARSFQKIGNLIRNPVTDQRSSYLDDCWSTLEMMSHRLNRSQAHLLIQHAVNSEHWSATPAKPNQVVTLRKEMVSALSACAQRMTKSENLRLAKSAIELATTRKQSYDYPQVLNLLCNLVRFGGARTKDYLRKQLYPPGQALNTYLLQITSAFDQPINRSDLLNKDAARISENILKQVQILEKGLTSEQPPQTLFTFTHQRENETLYVHYTGADELRAILKHGEALSARSIKSLLDSTLEMISSSQNLNENKFALINELAGMGQFLSRTGARHAINQLWSFGEGDVSEPDWHSSQREGQNPMSRFRTDTIDRFELCAASIRAIFAIEQHHSCLSNKRRVDLLEKSICSPASPIRRAAVGVVAKLKKVDDQLWNACLLATRDSYAQVAATAFFALSKLGRNHLSQKNTRRMVEYALEMATQVGDESVRREAAFCSVILHSKIEDKKGRETLRTCISVFEQDKYQSVRDAVSLGRIKLKSN